MIQKMRKRMEGEGGFTLIELLVVIIIIAILAAIAIPTFLGQRQKAQDAAAKSLVRNAMTAMESAYVDTRAFDDVTKDDLEKIEPSITFTGEETDTEDSVYGTPTADAQEDTVDFAADADNTYAIGSESQSEKTFAVQVDKGAEGGTTWYIDGEPVDSW